MVLAALFAAVGATAATAQSVSQPVVHVEDSWTYKFTNTTKAGFHQDENVTTVRRVDSDAMLIAVKPLGSEQAPLERLINLDWSRSRSVNGVETVINRPVAFPMAPGKTWTVEFNEDNPNRQFKSELTHLDYKVIGWEDVTVPAGTFKALKVEAHGRWTAQVAPAVTAVTGARVDAQGAATVSQANRILPATVTGRIYKAFWYVPEVKRVVKSDEEMYSTNGERSEDVEGVLESYKVTP
jgi:hypothetical protein